MGLISWLKSIFTSAETTTTDTNTTITIPTPTNLKHTALMNALRNGGNGLVLDNWLKTIPTLYPTLEAIIEDIDDNTFTPNSFVNAVSPSSPTQPSIGADGKIIIPNGGSTEGVASLNELTGEIEIKAKPQFSTTNDNNPIGIDVSPQDNKLLLGYDVNKMIDQNTIRMNNDTGKIEVNGSIVNGVFGPMSMLWAGGDHVKKIGEIRGAGTNVEFKYSVIGGQYATGGAKLYNLSASTDYYAINTGKGTGDLLANGMDQFYTYANPDTGYLEIWVHMGGGQTRVRYLSFRVLKGSYVSAWSDGTLPTGAVAFDVPTTGGGVWGEISGNIATQTDLVNALTSLDTVIESETLNLDGSSKPNYKVNLFQNHVDKLAMLHKGQDMDANKFLNEKGDYVEVGSGGEATNVTSNSLTVTGSGSYDVNVELSSATQSTLALAQSQLYHVAQADVPYIFDNTYCVLNSLSMDGNNLNFNISWNTAVELEANQKVDILTMNTGIVGEKILYETTNGKVSFIGNKLSFINKSAGAIIMFPAGNVFTGPVALTVPVVSPTYVDEQLTLLNNTITSFVNNKFMSRYGKGFTGSSADGLLLKTEVKTTFTPWIIETFLDCDGWMWKIQWTGLSKSNQICNIYQLYATSNTHKVYGTDWYFEMSKTEQSICIHKNNPTSFSVNTTLLALSENAYRAYVDYQGQSGAGDWTQITPTILGGSN